MVTYSDFDARGKAHRKVDGSATLTFEYDLAERLTEVNEVTGLTTSRPLKVLTYGASNVGTDKRLGKLESASRYNYVDLATLIGQEIPRIYQVTESYTYAGLGGRASSRLTEVLEGATPQASFQLAMDWDDLGQRTGLTYPACTACGVTASRVVDFAYNFGYLTAISSDAILAGESIPEGIETQISYHPNGLVQLIQHDSGRKEVHTVDPTGPSRPGRIELLEGGTTTVWTTGDYRYDGAGNIVEMGDSWFRYDGVSRLVNAHVSTSPTATGSLVSQSYEFDGFGNIQEILGSPGRATPTSPDTNRLESGVYDNRGNLTNWLSTSYRYDALGSMWRTTAGSQDWVYLYNADGERVLAKRLGGDTYHRWSLRDTAGQVLRDYLEGGNPVTWVVEKDYLYRGDKLLASETPTAVTEYHLDHLGTPRALSKNGGSLTFHTYYPFGEEAGLSLDTERMKFTGHERDLGDPNSTSDDLDYMHARFCSPVLGRFLSVDPSHESRKPSFPQTWNRFSYARDNPINRYDPDGRADMGSGFDKEIHTSCGDRACGSSEPSMQALNGLVLFTGVGPLAASPALLGPGGLAAEGLFYLGVRFQGALEVLRSIGSGLIGGPSPANQISGFIERQVATKDNVRLLGNAVTEGSTLILKDVAIYGDRAKVDLGAKALLSALRTLATELQEKGYKTLVVRGVRYSGAKPGKNVDLTISIDEFLK